MIYLIRFYHTSFPMTATYTNQESHIILMIIMCLRIYINTYCVIVNTGIA